VNRLWSLRVLFALTLLSLSLAVLPAAAQVTEELTLDETTCGVLGGAWNADLSQCVLEAGGAVTEGQILTIAEDVSLWVFAGKTFTNNGTVVNLGTIDNDGTFDNYGVVLNGGTFNNRAGRAILGTLYNYGTFTNRGAIVNDGLIDNRGIFTSDGRIQGDGEVLGTIDYLTIEELCSALDVFIGQVNAVTGDLVTAEQAELLVGRADESKAVLGCP
jgi:hypothetical protein